MAVFITGLTGIIFVYLGIITLNGSYKKWYLGPRIFPPQALVYASIPFGVAAIELCLIVIFTSSLNPDTTGWIITIIVAPTTIFGFILAAWRPKWIKPHWVQWLEENYDDKIYILIADARSNPIAWETRVSTQIGLEEWAEEVVGKPSR